MTSSQLRRLEIQLTAAERTFLEGSVYGPAAEEFRREIDVLPTKITAERIRTEEREKRSREAVVFSPSEISNMGI